MYGNIHMPKCDREVLEEIFVQLSKDRFAIGEHYKRVFGPPSQLPEGVQ